MGIVVSSTFTFDVRADNDRVIYPLKEVSKLECRFDEFSTLSKDCKEQLPVLKTKDYKKYIKKDWGYNSFTRLYTVLWGSSYKYGWDVWNGGHQWVDIATAKGTPVYSIADWIVIVAKKDPSWWNVISIQHTIRWKVVVSNYAHLAKMNVTKWKIVKVWTRIWDVWSTGNSTWNHLHFQLDLEHLFHPFYYSWKTCPYGYYEITEKGVCFDELARHTLDPLRFLESEWALLDNIQVNSIAVKKEDAKSTAPEKKEQTKEVVKDTTDIRWGVNMNIFSKTVHADMSSTQEDIKEVQKVYEAIWYYKWKIDWNFTDLEKAIIAFQVDKKVISSKADAGAGWFWPKTRAHTKSAYLKSLSNKWDTDSKKDEEEKEKVYIWQDIGTTTTATSKVEVEKISRDNILSREDIEKREISEFMKNNEINIDLENVWWNIEVGKKFKVSLEILKKVNSQKRRPYNGALPWDMTFEIDSKTVSVFPKKISYISRWDRDIQLKWLKAWNTTLKINLWSQTIAEYKLRVIWDDVKIYPKEARIISSKKLTLWEEKTGIILFKDTAGKNMINVKYNWSYTLKTWEETEVCIKRWSIKEIWKIYRKKCEADEYVKNPEITYSDSVWWLVLFDFKSYSDSSKQIELVGKWSGNKYAAANFSVDVPKWLNSKYEYYNETVAMLEKWVVGWIKKGYFMEDKSLTERDALTWMKQTLVSIKKETSNSNTKAQVNKKLVELAKEWKWSYKEITRKAFLDKSYKYLVINDSGAVSIEYKDLQQADNKKANAIFGKDSTWKDKFWESHFQPKEVLTRGEWAYMLSKALEKTTRLYLTLR